MTSPAAKVHADETGMESALDSHPVPDLVQDLDRPNGKESFRKFLFEPVPTDGASGKGESQYDPLSSVWEGNDANLLERMFAFYASIPVEPILDSTFNRGRFWRGSSRRVVSMDINPKHQPMIVGDNRVMAGVPSEAFGVVVYDPPHVGPQGRDKSRKRFDEDFGATMECGKEHGWTLSYLYPPFLEQAKRVLKPEGLLLAKITDMVNCHRSRWAHCDFMRMADEAGFTVCDLIVKVRAGPMASNKWRTAHHARKRHCFWIVCRNGTNCERRFPT